MNHDELRKQHVKVERIKELCNWCLEDWPCAVVRLLDEHAALGETASELIRHLADRMVDCPRCDDLRERLIERVRV